MALWQEFKAFINRGNVVDLAVAVVIGGAFGKIVSSLVADIIMPAIGYLSGGVNFTSLKYVFGGTPEKPAAINYGNFLQASFDFLLIALTIFFVIKLMNRFRLTQPATPEAPPPSPEVLLLNEIRDLLQRKNLP